MSPEMIERINAHRKQGDYLRERVGSSELKMKRKDKDAFRRNIFGDNPLPEPTIEECWIWKGEFSDSGRPITTVNGKRVGAARAAYATWIRPLYGDRGPDRPADIVRHGCDNFACVNPAHLGTARYPISFDDTRHQKTEKKRAQSNIDRAYYGSINSGA